MNAHLEEIGFEAFEYARSRAPGKDGVVTDEDVCKRFKLFEQKFAEMLILKCAEISIDVDDTMTNQGLTGANAIKEYFGIE